MTDETIKIDLGNKSRITIKPIAPVIGTLTTLMMDEFWGWGEDRSSQAFEEFDLYNAEINFGSPANPSGLNQIVVKQLGIGDDEDDTVRMAVFDIAYPMFKHSYNSAITFSGLLTGVKMYDPGLPLPWDGVEPQPNAKKYEGPMDYPYTPPAAKIKGLKLPWPVTITNYNRISHEIED